MKNKYYDINKLKEMLIGKHLINSTSLKIGILRYGIIVDLDKIKVVVREETNGESHFWFVPYNSKDWLLCD